MTAMELLETSLEVVYERAWSKSVSEILYGPPDHPHLTSVADAYDTIRSESAYQLPAELIPLALVDERSIACVVSAPVETFGLETGDVVRWHLDEVALDKQAMLLDLDPLLYLRSVEEELAHRPAGLGRVLDQIGPAYEDNHLGPIPFN